MDEVRQVYQDKDGYIWIATNSGLCLYDGYQIRTFKSNLHTPGLLSNNTINCITDDNRHNLWIATYDGVNVLDKTNGQIRKITCPGLQRSIVDRLLVTSSDRVFIGTETGVFEYLPGQDSCIAFKPGIVKGAVKALVEDSRRNLWIGTWSDGIFRYDGQKDEVYAYPALNELNSALGIFEDSKQRIWVASWGYGLFLLENPYEPEYLGWKQFRHDDNDPNSLCYDIVYDMEEDLNTGTLWVGTRGGLSVLYDEENGLFRNYCPDNSDKSVHYNDVNSVFRDDEGMMWLGLLGGGVNTVITRKPEFRLDRLEAIDNPLLTNSSVRSLMVDREGLLWIGLGSWGFFVHDRAAGSYTHNLSDVAYRLYTVSDGLQDNIFYRNTAFTDTNGEMFFGGYRGYNSFFPDRMTDEETFPPVRITDIKIYNRSWSLLDAEEKEEISRLAPDFTDRIRLDYRKNNFSIEFAALSFSNPRQIKYAYKLEGLAGRLSCVCPQQCG